MEPSRDDRLFAALESLRPAPAPGFAAELDERAAAGFPPRVHPASAPFARLAAWFRGLSPRRLVLTGGATALAVVAIATVIVASSDSDKEGTNALSFTAGGVSEAGNEHFSSPTPESQGNRGGSNQPAGGAQLQPESTGSESSSGAQYESGLSSLPSASAATGSKSDNYIQAQQSLPSVEVVPGTPTGPTPGGTGPYASGAKHRDVERAAEMVLGTEPGEVGDAAGKVLETVHQYDGIVLNSSVRGGSEGDAGAEFELLVPSTKLSDALAAFSSIAKVRSRHEASNDITAPTNTIGEGLQDSHAKIDALLNELADSETEAEREAIEAQLRAERHHAAALKAQLSNLQRRANLSHVSVRIETDASSAPSANGGWDVGDAFHDAGQILSIAAGVAIVGLAVLAPIALLVLLVWLGNRVWLRQRRERALG
jgi:Domain of unknown function (DUF4349)